jgi:hypothetical protein
MKACQKRQLSEHQTFKTLKQQQSDGILATLPHVRLRAQLALAEKNNPADLMRAAFMLIQRVRAYYDAAEYCAPRGDIHRDLPTAYSATLTRYYGGFYRGTINVALPTEGPASVWNKAGSLCLDTAIAVAQWEICQNYPEAADIINASKEAALNACKNSDFSGIYWRDAKRRIGTKKIRAMLDTVLTSLQQAYFVIHPETGVASFRTEQNFIWAQKKLEEIAASEGKPLQYVRMSPLQTLRAA